MYLLYNNHLLQESDLRLPVTNRAFQYNDGFFETIIVRQGHLCFWPDHVQRMQEAAAVLNLSLPLGLSSPAFTEMLLNLASKEQALSHGRLKLKFWRSGAGLYTPESNQVDWMATIQSAIPVSARPLQIGLSRQVRTQYSRLSQFKGPNSPVYVMAALEKDIRQLDDMLLLDPQNRVGECVASNVFWIKENTLFTPALETGCINGIARRNILRWCNQNGTKAAVVLADVDQLYHADGVFSANVTGIRKFASIEDISLPTLHPLVDQLHQKLFSHD